MRSQWIARDSGGKERREIARLAPTTGDSAPGGPATVSPRRAGGVVGRGRRSPPRLLRPAGRRAARGGSGARALPRGALRARSRGCAKNSPAGEAPFAPASSCLPACGRRGSRSGCGCGRPSARCSRCGRPNGRRRSARAVGWRCGPVAGARGRWRRAGLGLWGRSAGRRRCRGAQRSSAPRAPMRTCQCARARRARCACSVGRRAAPRRPALQAHAVADASPAAHPVSSVCDDPPRHRVASAPRPPRRRRA